MWLIMVHGLSMWPEVIQMTTTGENVVDILCSLFARYGLPKSIVTDNITQFTSSVFESFCKNNGINHKQFAL